MTLLRKYGFNLKTITIELHVFADTSLCAYKTVAYFRFIQEHNFKCMFIAWKSRLVPLSQNLSILRLVLQAAVIAIRLKNTVVVSEIPVEKGNTFPWTNSKIVINHLNNNDANVGVCCCI